MQSNYQDSRYEHYLEELADLDAWEGYEFWSAQLEANIDFLAEPGHVEETGLSQPERDERKSDVLPF
ncbi:MAG TPA: hypothetical protein VF762_25160 [Blastocatellia bacterium]|jgi:hypothetical protein